MTIFIVYFILDTYLSDTGILQMTTEELYESYGFDAHRKGFFEEWRMETSSLIQKDPKMNRADAAYRAYERLHRQKVAERKVQERLSN